MNAQGTIEFRQHSGTIESEKVENWIRLLVSFVEKGKVSKPRARQAGSEWTAAKEMHLFFAMFDVGASVAAYYIARRKVIAAQDKERAQRQADAATPAIVRIPRASRRA